MDASLCERWRVQNMTHAYRHGLEDVLENFWGFFEQLDEIKCRQSYFQQEGTTGHTPNVLMESVKSVFEDRTFSKRLFLHYPQMWRRPISPSGIM